MRRIKEWLRETHGSGFELLRHFLLRFFDNDVITTPGQMTTPLVGAVSLLLPWFQVLAGPLRKKYAYFSHLATPEPFRLAVRADELWLITLMMSSIGLLTAIKWQSLFPGLRDYRTLGSLPLHAWQIFLAKLLALLVMATAAIVVLNLFPGLLFPMVTGGQWAFEPSPTRRILAYVTATLGACYFFFFALLAIQGVLLNMLRARLFGLVAGYVQGFLVAAMLILMVLSFSIDSPIATALLKPELAKWLPPVWFLGLYQKLLGDPNPAMRELAGISVWALTLSVVSALIAYIASYKRHRVLLVEGAPTASSEGRRQSSFLLDWLLPRPRERAVITFMAKTLAHSSQHRMILMGYGGFGLAILLSGMIGMSAIVQPGQVVAARFVYAHVILLIFLLLGFRHLSAIPIELKANWMFQITEREGRVEWLRAVDRFVITLGAIVMLILPLPLEIYQLGWRSMGEVILFATFGMVCYEGIFSSWDKLPFTCSYLPGKTPMLALALGLLGLLTFLPVVNGILLAALYKPRVYAIVMVLLVGAWARVHAMRTESWGEQLLKYDDLPEPVIHGLNLAR